MPLRKIHNYIKDKKLLSKAALLSNLLLPGEGIIPMTSLSYGLHQLGYGKNKKHKKKRLSL